ncbi:MAG: hypothetical protein WD040_02710 [Anaerolineales bacterium]
MPRPAARPRPRSHTRAAQAAALRRVREELHKVGLLLAVDRDLPNVFRAATGRVPAGSWWADPDSHLIYAILGVLARDGDILRLRLINAKWTYVHRRLWPAVLSAAGQRGGWQREGLSPRARRLLERVGRRGVVDLNTPAARGRISLKQAGEAARELERRILVLSFEVHTPQGTHTKRLESWETWRRRNHVRRSALSAVQARARLEAAAEVMAMGEAAAGRLPWPRRSVPPRSPRAARRIKK